MMHLAWSIVYRPAISPLHIAAGAAVLAVLAGLAYLAGGPAVGRMRKLPLLAMRLAVIAALAGLLMGPSVVPDKPNNQRHDRLTIVLDTSRSMLTDDVNGRTRIAAALADWLGPQQLNRLASRFDFRLLGLAETIEPLSAQELSQADELAKGRATRLAGGLADILLKTDPQDRATMLLISDGRDSADQSILPVALLARARNVPIHTVCLGGPAGRRDLALAVVPRQHYLLAGESGQLAVSVYRAGLAVEQATVRLTHDGRELTTGQATFGQSNSANIDLPVKFDAPGLYEVRVGVDPADGEDELANNGQTVFLEVTDRAIRVLILEGEPFWETKFLASSLRKDSRIELTQVSQVTPSRHRRILTAHATSQPGATSRPADGPPGQTGQPGVPESAEQFSAYDVVLVGRRIENVLSADQARALAEAVSVGGLSVVFARGVSYDENTADGRAVGRELSAIEPVVWSRSRANLASQQGNVSVVPSAAGRASPLFSSVGPGTEGGGLSGVLARLPSWPVLFAVERAKTATQVLARAVSPGRSVLGGDDPADPPAIVAMDYGRGKIVAVLGEGLWRWSLLPPESADLDGIYDAFWSNMVRWLASGSDFMPGQQAAIRLGGGGNVRLGDPVAIEVVFRGGMETLDWHAVRVTILGPHGSGELALAGGTGFQPVSGGTGFQPVRLRGTFQPDKPGVYTVAWDQPGRVGSAGDNSQEESGESGKSGKKIEKRFSVYDFDMELLAPAADPESMARLAEQSGGAVLDPTRPEALLDELDRRQAMRSIQPPPEFIWDKLAILLVLTAWCGAEWLIRRRVGLV